jgi:hypothetical protein
VRILSDFAGGVGKDQEGKSWTTRVRAGDDSDSDDGDDTFSFKTAEAEA